MASNEELLAQMRSMLEGFRAFFLADMKTLEEKVTSLEGQVISLRDRVPNPGTF